MMKTLSSEAGMMYELGCVPFLRWQSAFGGLARGADLVGEDGDLACGVGAATLRRLAPAATARARRPAPAS